MDTFVVKGGSAIDLIYKLDARASVDIDLSIHYSQQGVPSAYEEFVSIRNRFKNFAVILYI